MPVLALRGPSSFFTSKPFHKPAPAPKGRVPVDIFLPAEKKAAPVAKAWDGGWVKVSPDVSFVMDDIHGGTATMQWPLSKLPPEAAKPASVQMFEPWATGKASVKIEDGKLVVTADKADLTAFQKASAPVWVTLENGQVMVLTAPPATLTADASALGHNTTELEKAEGERDWAQEKIDAMATPLRSELELKDATANQSQLTGKLKSLRDGLISEVDTADASQLSLIAYSAKLPESAELDAALRSERQLAEETTTLQDVVDALQPDPREFAGELATAQASLAATRARLGQLSQTVKASVIGSDDALAKIEFLFRGTSGEPGSFEVTRRQLQWSSEDVARLTAQVETERPLKAKSLADATAELAGANAKIEQLKRNPPPPEPKRIVAVPIEIR